jgi:hypothetical protein
MWKFTRKSLNFFFSSLKYTRFFIKYNFIVLVDEINVFLFIILGLL